MKLIIGLGNPEQKYYETRHNLGFKVIELLFNEYFKDFSKPTFNKKFQTIIATGNYHEEKIILAKPETYMNNSGQAVAKLLDYYKVETEDLWVIHDDLDLEVGRIKISRDSSAGGHNGIQSIIDFIKTNKFWRFRIGIGKPTDISIEKYVLQLPLPTERDDIALAISNTAESIIKSLTKDPALIQNTINQK